MIRRGLPRVLTFALAITYAVATTDTTAATAASSVCTALKSSLGSTKVQISGTQYTASAEGAWNVFNQQDTPTCIVFPANANDVSTAMKAIVKYNSNYAVRGAGHSAMMGWNTIETGVFIDFSTMTAMSYDAATHTIHLEPGLRWGQVYDEMATYGVAPVGGRVADVGVSGLLLGGGMSFLSPAYGWAADRIRAMTVVLVNGDIVNATATNSYKDLFYALKGSGGRLGIVTHYQVDAIPTGLASDKRWYGGSVFFTNTSATGLLVAKAFDDFIANNVDPKASIIVSLVAGNVGVPGTLTLANFAAMFYNGTEAQFNKVFAKFLAIPQITGVGAVALGPLSYHDITTVLPGGTERYYASIFGASSLYPKNSAYENAYTSFLNFTKICDQEVFLGTLSFTPVPQTQTVVSRSLGGTPFTVTQDGNYAAVLYEPQFLGDVTPSSTFTNALKLLYAQNPSSAGLPLYLNEADANQPALASYPGYAQLKTTYAKYDPNRFNVQHVVGPIGL